MQNPLFWEVNGIYFQIKYMCSRLNHEYSLSMLCSSSGKVEAGTGGEEEVDGVLLCVFVVFHIREIFQEEIRIWGHKKRPLKSRPIRWVRQSRDACETKAKLTVPKFGTLLRKKGEIFQTQKKWGRSLKYSKTEGEGGGFII